MPCRDAISDDVVVVEEITKPNIGGIIMPRGDGTGPQGFGPMTGRGAGFCAGYEVAGFANRGYGLGLGRARRGGAYGGRNSPAVPQNANFSANAGNSTLASRIEALQQQLEDIKKQLGDKA